MPKTNLCKPAEDPRLGYLREVISGGMARKKISVGDMAVKIGISKSAMYKRRKNPETFIVSELLAVLDILQPDEGFENKILRRRA